MSKTGALSRNEILVWVNKILMENYEKIEDLCNGTAFCQLMDMLHPDAIQLKKVKFNAKSEHEFIHNFKLFQNALTKMNIDKQIPILKLVKGHFADNYELLHWFKKYFDTNYDNNNSSEYNAYEIRNKIKKEQLNNRRGSINSLKPLIKHKSCSNHSDDSGSTTTVSRTPSPLLRNNSYDSSTSQKQQLSSMLTSSSNDHNDNNLSIEKYKHHITIVTNERDFYYNKIKKIENILSAEKEKIDFVNNLLQKLHDAINSAELCQS